MFGWFEGLCQCLFFCGSRFLCVCCFCFYCFFGFGFDCLIEDKGNVCHSFSDAVCSAAGCWFDSFEHTSATDVYGFDIELIWADKALSFLAFVVSDSGLEEFCDGFCGAFVGKL